MSSTKKRQNQQQQQSSYTGGQNEHYDSWDPNKSNLDKYKKKPEQEKSPVEESTKKTTAVAKAEEKKPQDNVKKQPFQTQVLNIPKPGEKGAVVIAPAVSAPAAAAGGKPSVAAPEAKPQV